MNHWSSSESQSAIFSRLLAELVTRLRLSHVENHHMDLSWPVCSRLAVQADLLGGLARESGLESLTDFSTTLAELATLGQNDPNQIPMVWSGAMDRLAEFLDRMMIGLDDGDAPSRWLGDAQWERLTSWFTHLETPFLVMDELEEILRQWQDSWCDDVLDPEKETELQEQWQQLRGFGDALFSSSSADQDTSLLRWKGFTP